MKALTNSRRNDVLMALAIGMVALMLSPPAVWAEGNAVRVILEHEATAAGSVVMLSDIAQFTGVTPLQRQQLEAVDVTDFPATSNTIEIGQTLVQMRLQLASPSLERLQVTGARKVLVRRPVLKSYDDAVERAVQSELAQIWSVDPSAVRVKLLQPLDPALFIKMRDESDLDVALLPQSRPGNNRVKLLIHQQGRLTETKEVLISSQLFAEQLIAAVDLSRGQILDPTLVTVQWQAVTNASQVVAPEVLLGKQLTVPVRGGQVIQARHVTTAQPLQSANVVNPRDRVRVVARKGNLTVSLAEAEVLQAGGVGDSVRVRNPDTKKIITAKVVNASEVIITL